MVLNYLILISFICSLTAHAIYVSNLKSILSNFDKNDDKLSISGKTPAILIVAPGEAGYRLLTPDDAREESDESSSLTYKIIKRLLDKQSLKKNKEIDELKYGPYNKDILRAALIARCSKVDDCKKTCPSKSKKKSKCQRECADNYDEENLCDEESASCEDDNCGGGKTMPPNWYL